MLALFVNRPDAPESTEKSLNGSAKLFLLVVKLSFTLK